MNYEEVLALTQANAKAIAELRANTHAAQLRLDKELAAEKAQREQDNARRDKELAAEKAQRDKELAAHIARWDKFMEKYGNYMDNEGRKIEAFFIEGIRKNNLIVGSLEFDEIIHSSTRTKKNRVAIELDALLLNGTSVGILEVKSTLHRNDVVKVRDSLIPRFREFYREYQDKALAVIVAGELVNPDAVELARELGFIVIQPDNQELSIDYSCYRAI